MFIVLIKHCLLAASWTSHYEMLSCLPNDLATLVWLEEDAQTSNRDEGPEEWREEVRDEQLREVRAPLCFRSETDRSGELN